MDKKKEEECRDYQFESYEKLKKKHQDEFNRFPFMFAFSNEQFCEGMQKWGLKPTDTDKIYSLGDTGGFYLKTDAPRLREMRDRHERERKEAIANDKTGDGYIFEMFDFELKNHEYGYTGSIDEAIDALGLTVDEINADGRLLHGLEKAMGKKETI